MIVLIIRVLLVLLASPNLLDRIITGSFKFIMPLEELNLHTSDKATAITVGVFDGVHLGHKSLLLKLKEVASEENLTSVAITFKTHPREVINKGIPVPCLTCFDQKVALLKQAGVNIVIALAFSSKIASVSAEDFLTKLHNTLHMKHLIIGRDFALGKNREGNPEMIRRLSSKIGFKLTVVEPLFFGDEEISSTAIRKALQVGDVKKANSMMGRFFRLEGAVEKGEARGGSKLGFPTANIHLKQNQAIPADGVYAAVTYLNSEKYCSIANIGVRPTFGGGQRMVEVHILNFTADLYGLHLKIDIIEPIRREKRFPSAQALSKQIVNDISVCKSILKKKGME